MSVIEMIRKARYNFHRDRYGMAAKFVLMSRYMRYMLECEISPFATIDGVSAEGIPETFEGLIIGVVACAKDDYIEVAG